jgi:hypothetical protein
MRASKQEAELQDKTEGKQAGRKWAEEKAEYAELRRVSEIPDGGFASWPSPRRATSQGHQSGVITMLNQIVIAGSFILIPVFGVRCGRLSR